MTFRFSGKATPAFPSYLRAKSSQCRILCSASSTRPADMAQMTFFKIARSVSALLN